MAGRPRNRPEESERHHIEAAAAALFAAQGFAGVSVDEIAAAAGVSKPGIYRLYRSKTQLYVHLVEQFAAAMAQASLDAIAAQEGTPEQRLRTMIRVWFEMLRSDPATWVLTHREERDPQIRAALARIKTMQVGNDVALLRAWLPTLSPREAEPLGEVLRGALVSLGRWWIGDDVPAKGVRRGVPIDVPVDAMVRVCLGLLATAPR